MQIREVELTRRTKEVLDTFEEVFKERFGRTPIMDNADRAAARSLVESLEDQKDLLGFVGEYVYLEDDFLNQEGYPLRLLTKRINTIVVRTAQKKMRPSISRKGVMMMPRIYCDECGKQVFLAVALDHDFDTRVTCEMHKDEAMSEFTSERCKKNVVERLAPPFI